MFLDALSFLNNSKIMWGITMILLNMGSKYIMADLGKAHEEIMKRDYFKKIILFSMFFVATRDIITSFLLTVVYIIVVDGLLHEHRNFSMTTHIVDISKPNKSSSAYETYLNNINMMHN